MGSLDRNLFWIGRRRGDENQLTQLLAALLAHDETALPAVCDALGIPDAGEEWTVELEVAHSHGRFDLVLRSPPDVIAVVESKVGADLSDGQVRRYLEFLAGRGERNRSLTVLSPKAVELPAADRALAGAKCIHLGVRNWDRLASALQHAGGLLARDFSEMLVAEGLARPPAVTARDWEIFH